MGGWSNHMSNAKRKKLAAKKLERQLAALQAHMERSALSRLKNYSGSINSCSTEVQSCNGKPVPISSSNRLTPPSPSVPDASPRTLQSPRVRRQSSVSPRKVQALLHGENVDGNGTASEDLAIKRQYLVDSKEKDSATAQNAPVPTVALQRTAYPEANVACALPVADK